MKISDYFKKAVKVQKQLSQNRSDSKDENDEIRKLNAEIAVLKRRLAQKEQEINYIVGSVVSLR